jgi:cell division transport system permease protein
MNVVVTVLVRAWRNVASGGLPFFFSTLMTALGLFALAAFAVLWLNFDRVAKTVGESVAAVAFLKVDDAAAAEEIRARISLHPAVAAAKLVTPADALARATRGLGDHGKALEGTAGLHMPWVVEVVPRFSLTSTTAGTTRAELVDAIEKMDGVDEVMHPAGDVTRIEALVRLLQGVGIFLTVLVALVVVVVVSNAVKLSVLARKDEIAIMKLVGATDMFVRLPFVLAGAVQGLVGAVLALVVLAVAHTSIAGVARVALSGSLGAFELDPLPLVGAFVVVIAGVLLGTVGALFSVGRFLRV